MRIRSLTLHLRWDDDFTLVENFLKASRSLQPLTVRVSVSPPPPSEAERIIKRLRDMGVGYISIAHLYYGWDDIYRLVSQYGVFASTTDVLDYLQFLKAIYSRGEVHLSRYVAFLAGGVVYNSPYFPASITTRTGVSLSLLYPNDLSALGDVEDVLKKGEELGRYAASSIGVEFLGVDGSLSPWGEESVAKAIERIFGIKLGSSGSFDAIYRLNKAIEAAGVKKVGFNEVMLPLAEDEELKRLVRGGELDLHKFVSYVSVCIPGLDMAPIKIATWDSLKRLLYDIVALAKAKGRAVGVRIFPVDVDEYEVAGFGKTPALTLRQ